MVRKSVNFNRSNIFIEIFGFKMYIHYLRTQAINSILITW